MNTQIRKKEACSSSRPFARSKQHNAHPLARSMATLAERSSLLQLQKEGERENSLARSFEEYYVVYTEKEVEAAEIHAAGIILVFP